MTDKEKRQTVRITNIQRFCLHDGPGIRTTVFLKGCPIRCPWCANPENIRYDIEKWRLDNGESGEYGYDITLDDLTRELQKDRTFYLEGGGVTFSGGEPLLQFMKYEALLRDLRADDVHLTVETALFVDTDIVKRALRYFDFWYVDMKLLDKSECTERLHGDADKYLRNIEAVAGGAKQLCVRIPCVRGLTDSRDNMQKIADVILANGITEVEIFGIHDLAEKKYRSMGITPPSLSEKSDEAVGRMERTLASNGIRAKIVRM